MVKIPRLGSFECVNDSCKRKITAKQIEKAGGYCPHCGKDYYR